MEEEELAAAPKPKVSLADLQEVLKGTPELRLSPAQHEVNLIPTAVKIRFIDSIHMPVFEPFAESSFRSVKLINLGKPAINLTFFEKHKYNVNRQPEPEEIAAYLKDRQQELMLELTQLSLFDLKQQLDSFPSKRKELEYIGHVLEHFHDYEFATSNYYRYYTYWYVNWRWITPDGTLDYGQEHLLKDETDYQTQTTTLKQNIIFVNTQRIGEHTPYQSKKVESFLESFPQRLEFGTFDLFVRGRVEKEKTQTNVEVINQLS